MGILTAQGIPNDQLGAASASLARQLGVEDPNAPIDVNNPQVRNVLVPAIQQLKRMGVGQVVPQQPQTAQAVSQQPQASATAQVAPNPQQNQGTFGAPSAIATRGAIRPAQTLKSRSKLRFTPRSPATRPFRSRFRRRPRHAWRPSKSRWSSRRPRRTTTCPAGRAALRHSMNGRPRTSSARRRRRKRQSSARRSMRAWSRPALKRRWKFRSLICSKSR
jgi:hypothetical protein